MERRDKRVILCLAHMSGNEMKYVKEAFDTNWVVPLGPNVNAFEQELGRFAASPCQAEWEEKIGNEPYPQCIQAHESDPDKLWPDTLDRSCLAGKQVVALASGTSAVHLALVALGVGPDDEVLCQSFTFCASSHPVRYLGATPVFVDSEPETWNMDPELLEEAIRDRLCRTGRLPKAIIVVYLYGMPAKIAEIKAVADKYGIPLVEDAAEGLGSRYRGQVCGTFGEFGVLSFNGNKMITTSGGGALVCPDAATRDRVMFYATQAREGYPYYQHEHIGYNYRLSNVCAGIGRGQLTVLREHVAWHRHIAHRYAEAFRGMEGFTFHEETGADSRSNYWLNTVVIAPEVRIKNQDQAYKATVKGAVGGAAGVIHQASQARTDCEPNDNVEALRLWLDACNVESRPLWKPMHRQPVYTDSPAYVNGVSEGLFKTGLCLPSGPLVTDDDVDFIIDAIREAVDKG